MRQKGVERKERSVCRDKGQGARGAFGGWQGAGGKAIVSEETATQILKEMERAFWSAVATLSNNNMTEKLWPLLRRVDK